MPTPKLVEVNNNVLKTIAKFYDRDEESLKGDVAKLKQWIKSQPHLPEILDDKAIQNFLILNKCSIEKSKSRIDMYYTLPSQIPEFYGNANPKCSNMKEIMNIAAWVVLPKMTKEMYRVTVFKMLDKEKIDRMQPVDVMALFRNFQEIRLREDVMFGDVFIYDMEGITFGYLSKLTPSVLAKILAIYEKMWSIPLKGSYSINCPPFMATVTAILKKIMKPKLFERIHICENTSILQDNFPKEILPKDYGGDERSVKELHDLMKIKLEEYQDRFDELDKMKVREELRPQKLQNDEILGFHGNFKKLNVD